MGDLAIIVKDLSGLPSSLTSLSGASASRDELRKALQRNTRVVKARPFYGANASTATSETIIHGTLEEGHTGNTVLKQFAIRADSSKTAHADNNATITLKKRFANATAVTIAVFNTSTVALGGTGDVTAFVRMNISSNSTFFNAANAGTDPGGCFTISAAKANTGLDLGDVQVECVFETV